MKKYLLTGFIFLMPIVLTLLIVVFLFDLFTDPVVSIVRPLIDHFYLPVHHAFVLILARLLSFLFLIFFIMLLGAIIQWFFGKQLMSVTDKILNQIPIVKTIYKTSRDLLGAFFSPEGQRALHYPVFTPFGSFPQKTLGFKSGQIALEIQEKLDEPMTPVFIPTVPHPLSGFLILVPEKDIEKAHMTNEEAFKFLVSCGAMVPPKEV